MMRVFVYVQNNSGGTFTGPAVNVLVHANTPAAADALAERYGVTFDDPTDCSCCGARWERASEQSFATAQQAQEDGFLLTPIWEDKIRHLLIIEPEPEPAMAAAS